MLFFVTTAIDIRIVENLIRARTIEVLTMRFVSTIFKKSITSMLSSFYCTIVITIIVFFTVTTLMLLIFISVSSTYSSNYFITSTEVRLLPSSSTQRTKSYPGYVLRTTSYFNYSDNKMLLTSNKTRAWFIDSFILKSSTLIRS